MSNTAQYRQQKNRFWEQTQVNIDGNPIYELHFIEYYEDEEILRFAKDKDDDTTWVYTSPFLNVENDIIFANDVASAMIEFESIIEDYIQEQIAALKEQLAKFKA